MTMYFKELFITRPKVIFCDNRISGLVYFNTISTPKKCLLKGLVTKCIPIQYLLRPFRIKVSIVK